jgi:hypothetical protein
LGINRIGFGWLDTKELSVKMPMIFRQKISMANIAGTMV